MISVEHLTKCYGDFCAVSDLSFEIEEGHVYGFLGPNGAGKSTTMNIMTGCLSPTDGHVKIGGFDIFEEPMNAKKLIGYLPEQPPLYMAETPLEYLKFVGEAKGLKGDELWKQIGNVIRLTKTEDVCERQISKLSKGYKQRVGIAQALLGNPKVIILDEPTVGLDPIQIIEIRDLIRELGREHTVIFSSHILSEVQTICDKVVIISHGKLVALDDTENLEKNLLGSGEIHLKTEAVPAEAEAILSSVSEITEWNILKSGDNTTKIKLTIGDADADEISRAVFFAFANKRRAILEMTAKKANLEEIFLELTQTDPDLNDDTENSPDDSDDYCEENDKTGLHIFSKNKVRRESAQNNNESENDFEKSGDNQDYSSENTKDKEAD